MCGIVGIAGLNPLEPVDETSGNARQLPVVETVTGPVTSLADLDVPEACL